MVVRDTVMVGDSESSGLIDTARERARSFGSWARRLSDELAQFPDTLADLRSGVNNFERASRRLADASDSLEEITRLYQSTMVEAARRTAGSTDALIKQMEALSKQSPDVLQASVSELKRTVDAFADLNPFWPRSRPPDA